MMKELREIREFFKRLTQPYPHHNYSAQEPVDLGPLADKGWIEPNPPTHLLDDLANHSFKLLRETERRTRFPEAEFSTFDDYSPLAETSATPDSPSLLGDLRNHAFELLKETDRISRLADIEDEQRRHHG